MPTVLIIIVTWNKRSDVERLLTSLAGMDYPSSAYDVLVVDNASRDGTADMVAERFPDVRLICNRSNLGGSGGFNTGLRWAYGQPEDRYDYFWLLDNDVIVHRRALVELVDVLRDHAAIGIAGSTMMRAETPWVINEMGGFMNTASGRLRFNRSGGEIAAFKHKPLGDLVGMTGAAIEAGSTGSGFVDVDYVAAASLLVKAGCARRIGLFNDYFIHFDDVEWCLRMHRSGYRCIASPTSFIWHRSSSSRTIPDQIHYYNYRNLLNMLSEYGSHRLAVDRLKVRIWIKALVLLLCGNLRTSYFHRKAIDDFNRQVTGKCTIAEPAFPVAMSLGWPRWRDIRSWFA
jgi:GT2 family glycosyltransferase